MSETTTFKNIQLKISPMGARLWRNNCGCLQDKRGQWIQYGVANPGGSDGIGLVQLEIKPHHVGKKLAVFLAVEVKEPGSYPTSEQKNFIAFVNEAGGLAFIAHTHDEAQEKIKKFLDT